MWRSSLSRLNPLSTKVLTTNSEGQSSLDAASYSASSIFSSSALYSCSWSFAAELLSVHIPAERPRMRSAYLRWASRAHRPRVDDIDLFCHAAWPSLQTLETAKKLGIPTVLERRPPRVFRMPVPYPQACMGFESEPWREST
jgi:hypothetical protein